MDTPRTVCPVCRAAGPQPITLHRDVLVDYFRCPSCGTIWNVPKETNGPIEIVARHLPKRHTGPD